MAKYSGVFSHILLIFLLNLCNNSDRKNIILLDVNPQLSTSFYDLVCAKTMFDPCHMH